MVATFRMPLYFVVHRPHPLMNKVRICDASSSWLGLPTGSRARAGVRSVGVVQPSDNAGCSIIHRLLYCWRSAS